ncbi:hypothetical protein Tco_0919644 [Tanacetum coccineum]
MESCDFSIQQERDESCINCKIYKTIAKDVDMKSFRLLHSISSTQDTGSAALNFHTIRCGFDDLRYASSFLVIHSNRGKALDTNLVVMESNGTKSGKQDTSSSLGNYITHVVDADIRPVNDQVSFVEDAEQYQVKDKRFESSVTSQNSTINNLKKQIKIVHKKSNKAKVKHDIDVIEIINIKLEHKVAKLLKENETLKKHYKDLYDSIKITRSKTIEQTTSLLANNADLKAQIQEKVLAIAALKNELRKLKENSVDTKFAKTSVLGKPVLQPLRNQSVVRQPYAFKSKRPKISKPQFASQVDVEKDLSKPVTQHYLPKGKESSFAKPTHMIASSSSRNSSKSILRFSSNDMVHNNYLEDAKKKTQEKDRNSESSVIHSTRLQHTTNDHKTKPRSNNQTTRSLPVSKSSCVTSNVVPLVDHSRNSSPFFDSKHFVCSTCHKCIFNANHDACITKLLKEVNSRKVKSHRTRNSNKSVDQKSHIQNPGRQIFIGHRSSPNKSSAVYEKISPRSCLRWKPMGRIFDIVGLRWIPTGNSFNSCTSKDDGEPPNGSNDDITNPYECDQTLNVSACTLNLSAGILSASIKCLSRIFLLRTILLYNRNSFIKPAIVQDVPSVSTFLITHEIQSLVIHQGVEEQIQGIQNDQFDNEPLLHKLTPDLSSKESSSQGVTPSNLHQLNQLFDNLSKWSKDHPLENVIGNPSRPVSTRSQLQTHAIVGANFDAHGHLIPFGGKWSG